MRQASDVVSAFGAVSTNSHRLRNIQELEEVHLDRFQVWATGLRRPLRMVG